MRTECLRAASVVARFHRRHGDVLGAHGWARRPVAGVRARTRLVASAAVARICAHVDAASVAEQHVRLTARWAARDTSRSVGHWLVASATMRGVGLRVHAIAVANHLSRAAARRRRRRANRSTAGAALALRVARAKRAVGSAARLDALRRRERRVARGIGSAFGILGTPDALIEVAVRWNLDDRGAREREEAAHRNSDHHARAHDGRVTGWLVCPQRRTQLATQVPERVSQYMLMGPPAQQSLSFVQLDPTPCAEAFPELHASTG